MKLIKEINSHQRSTTSLQEDDCGGGVAVSAGNVAVHPMPLLSNIATRQQFKSPKVIKYGSAKYKNKSKNKLGDFSLSNLFKVVEGFGPDKGNDDFDSSSVLQALKRLENKEAVDYRDTVTFGLVDSNEQIVKVTIPREQSSSFEQELNHVMGDQSESGASPEIAEVLFKLKNNYNIINVQWPDSFEDAEESSELEQPEQSPESELPDADVADMPEQIDTGSTDKVTDLLTQVIDMMKADAEARKSEAQAREAEAKTHQAKAAREQAMARVKQEEQMLDMESYQKNQKEKDKEAKRLAQLAKWKHDLENEKEEARPAQEPQYDFLPGNENKEYANIGKSRVEDEEYAYQPKHRQASSDSMKGKVTPSDIATFIMNRVK